MDMNEANRYPDPIEHAAEMLVADVEAHPGDYRTNSALVTRALTAQVLRHNPIMFLDPALHAAVLLRADSMRLCRDDSGFSIRPVFSPTSTLTRLRNENGDNFADRAREFVAAALSDGHVQVRVTTARNIRIVTATGVSHFTLADTKKSTEWNNITELEI